MLWPCLQILCKPTAHPAVVHCFINSNPFLIPPKTVWYQNKTKLGYRVKGFKLSEARTVLVQWCPYGIKACSWNNCVVRMGHNASTISYNLKVKINTTEFTHNIVATLWLEQQAFCWTMFTINKNVMWSSELWHKKPIADMHEDHKLLHQSTNFITCYWYEYRSNKGIQLHNSQNSV